MHNRRAALILTSAFLLTGCLKNMSQKSDHITRLEVYKSVRRLDAFSGNRKLRSFNVGLGFAPIGHKLQRGDGKTPLGRYIIDRKNPRSQFYLSLGISYPNTQDIQMAKARGVDPGGDIFIHGQPNNAKTPLHGDWTEGCIAVSNKEMDILYRAVPVGTPVHIYS